MSLVTVQIDTSTPEGHKEALRLIRKAEKVSHIHVEEDEASFEVKAKVYENMIVVENHLSGNKKLSPVEDLIADLRNES